MPSMQNKNLVRPDAMRKFNRRLLELVTLQSLSAVGLGVVLSLGCGGQASTPAPVIQNTPVNLATEKRETAPGAEPAKEPKGSEIGWNADVKKLVIPNAPLSGKLHGQAFVP